MLRLTLQGVISENFIKTIMEDGDGGSLLYVCTKCRLENNDSGGRTSSAGWSVSLVFEIVRQVSVLVEALLQQVSGIVQRLDNPQHA